MMVYQNAQDLTMYPSNLIAAAHWVDPFILYIINLAIFYFEDLAFSIW